MNYYIDSSAIVKLIAEEKDSEHVRAFVGKHLFSSVLSRVEVARTFAQTGKYPSEIRNQLTRRINFLPISGDLIDSIERIEIPRGVRSLDSIHIGSAQLIKTLVEGVITYDKKMQQALTQLGIAWFAPTANSET